MLTTGPATTHFGRQALVLSGTAGSAFVGPLDAFEPDISNAWSPTRRLFNSYDSRLVRLRRDSDNTELDFSADVSGYLDTASITTWLAGSNPFVVKIYAQKGPTDWVQSTAGNQLPLILSVAGFNNRSAVYTANNTLMNCAASPTVPYSISIIEGASVVASGRTLSSVSQNAIISAGRNVNGSAFYNGTIANPTASTTPVHEVLAAPLAGNFAFYAAGADITSASVASGNWGQINLGDVEPSLSYVSDVLIFNKALNPAEVTSLAAVSNPATL